MKILFGYLAVSFRGGTKFQLDFTRNFEKIEVGFLTSNLFVKYEKDVEAIGPIHRIPPTRKFIKRLKAYRKLAKEYDILYLNKTTLNPPELLIVKLSGFKKVVFHSHSVGKDCKNPFVKSIYYLLHYISRPWITVVADKMYACSKEAGVWLFGKRFVHEGTVVNNGIDACKFRFDVEKRQTIRRKLGIQGYCIMHAGAFSAVKNQCYLIGAFAQFYREYPDSILIFAGDGEFLEKAKEKVMGLGMEEHVRFLGQRNDIPDLMQAADLFVLPSLLEGVPFVAMEAQAAGLPCIITTTASKQVKITDLCEFFDVKRSEKELAECMKMKLTLKREDTFAQIVDAGFDLRCCAKELEKDLIGLLSEK